MTIEKSDPKLPIRNEAEKLRRRVNRIQGDEIKIKEEEQR